MLVIDTRNNLKQNIINKILIKNKIKMISLCGEIINIYTPRQLKNLGFFTKTIYGCCNNKFQTSQGYKWEWDDVK